MRNIIFEPTIGLNHFCEQSAIGKYQCSIATPYGFSCDCCLYDELCYLNEHGVKTVNSCCGHGNEELASILVHGDDSKRQMQIYGYQQIEREEYRDRYEENQITEWMPKTLFPYQGGL